MSQPDYAAHIRWQEHKYVIGEYLMVFKERDYKRDMLQAVRRYYSDTKRHIIYPKFRIPKG